MKTYLRSNIRVMILLMMCCLVSELRAESRQKTTESEARLQEVKKRFAQREREAVAKEFVGITADGRKVSGLYPIAATGVSTAPIVKAADAFLRSLSAEQKAKSMFAVDDEQWRKWLNVDNGIYARQGVSLKEMSQEQKSLAIGLMRASLSARGLEQTTNIMKTDQTLKELNKGDIIYDEELYFFTLMGNPSESEPWGWQIDGHHLVINYFVLGQQVVFSPAFMGAEPVITQTGKYKGNVLFQDEQNLGLAFMRSLSDIQQKMAQIEGKKRENMKSGAFQDNLILDYQGLIASKLSPEHQQALLHLIEQYVGKMKKEHALVKMDEVRRHMADTWFAWAGKTDENAVFYYRIHSPVVLIEFDHQGPIGINSKDKRPTRNHIHTMIRTPNGNDYGKDLLRQHLEKHHQH